MPRFVKCHLADPAARLPMPDRGFRPFSATGETVDAEKPFWRRALADGEIVEVEGTRRGGADETAASAPETDETAGDEPRAKKGK